jgi:hypothetical protein
MGVNESGQDPAPTQVNSLDAFITLFKKFSTLSDPADPVTLYQDCARIGLMFGWIHGDYSGVGEHNFAAHAFLLRTISVTQISIAFFLATLPRYLALSLIIRF